MQFFNECIKKLKASHTFVLYVQYLMCCHCLATQTADNSDPLCQFFFFFYENVTFRGARFEAMIKL